MCTDDIVTGDAWLFEYVQEQFKPREMYERAVQENNDTIKIVPDWFIIDDN